MTRGQSPAYSAAMKLELSALASSALIVVACGGDDTATFSPDGGADAHATPDATADSSPSVDASVEASADAASDASQADSAPVDAAPRDAGDAGRFPLNGCNMVDFDDQTAAGAARVINGPMTVAPSQFSTPCMMIKAGQSVTWNVLFASHPLEAQGGDAPSPIMGATGTTKSFTFPNAGLFGFDCAYHPLIMQGAILVVP